MGKFVLKTFVFITLTLGVYLMLVLLADGYSDPYYLRFTSPKQQSLILGTSRSAQGIQPAILDEALSEVYPGLKSFNFSFSLGHSPYGPSYYKAIQQKLDPSTKNGLFILAVDPWSICSQDDDPNDSLKFPEGDLLFDNLHFFNSNPNPEYFLRNYNKPMFTILQKKFGRNRDNTFLHDDGWLEVTVPLDSGSIQKRTKIKVLDYQKNMLPTYQFSDTRLKYLIKIIVFLKQHGDVYLVRLPVCKDIYQMEQELIYNFDEMMIDISNIYDVQYFSLMSKSDSCVFSDGNHLSPPAGEQVTRWIAEEIIRYNSK